MAIVKPFRGIRPAKEWVHQVISLPYDVMNREEATMMAEGNPQSFLHISRSEIDLPEEKDPYCEAVYKRASQNLQGFLADEILKMDEKPMYYIYQQWMEGRCQTGIAACVSIDDYKDNTIKKHELTRVEKELDRINHFDFCNANTEPVFLTYRDNLKIRSIIEGWVQSHKAESDVISQDGIRHMVWCIDDDSIVAGLESLFSEIPALYIADGHHRSASAAKVGELRRTHFPQFDGTEEFNRFLAVLFPDQDLKIFDYNRVVRGMNDLSEEEFFEAVKKSFMVEEKGAFAYRPEAKHDFSMYFNGVWYKLTAKDGTFDPANTIESLDVSILQNNLIQPILGVEDIRCDNRIDFVGGIRGLEELKRRADSDMTFGFALYPLQMEDLLEVSDRGLIMPPKSTWFEPKLASGLFVHQL